MASHASFRAEEFVEADTLRTNFIIAMSAMYRNKVPLYSDLIEIVRGVNETTLKRSEDRQEQPFRDGISARANRLDLERHGAIRLGTSYELHTIRRMFAILGMQPFVYYDLSAGGLPVHATCFRPKDTRSLSRNAFRVFTSLLRADLLNSERAHDTALSLFMQRQIFTAELLRLLEVAEAQDGQLTANQADAFIQEALHTFKWHPTAAATEKQYSMMRKEHPILADIACFRSAHINHLTPRTLDITAVQKKMCEMVMAVKSQIKGPPPRKCPLLLRQTSFLALEESILFPAEPNGGRHLSEQASGAWIQGTHTARFGEVEERGAAVTTKGRELHDQLLSESMAKAAGTEVGARSELMTETFEKYPDDWDTLRREGLIYCEYRVAKYPAKGIKPGIHEQLLEHLIQERFVEYSPITYEDFLPFSAAGIFKSNLRTGHEDGNVLGLSKVIPDLRGLEAALGCRILDPDQEYAEIQSRSLKTIARELGLGEETFI